MEELTKEQMMKIAKQFLIKIIQETDIMMTYEIEPLENSISVYLMEEKIKIVIDINRDSFIIDFFFKTIQNKEYLDELNSKIEYGNFFIDEKDNTLNFEMVSDYLDDRIAKNIQYIFDKFIEIYNNFSMPNENISQLLKTTLGENCHFNVKGINNKEKAINVKTSTIEEVAEFLANKDYLMCAILQRALCANFEIAIRIMDYLVWCSAVVITTEGHYKVVNKEKVKKAIIDLSPALLE